MHKTETEKGNATDAATLTRRLKRLLVYDRDMYFSKTLKDFAQLQLYQRCSASQLNAAQLGCRCSFE